MADPSLLGLPAEIRFLVFDHLNPKSNNITVGTVIADDYDKRYTHALNLVTKFGATEKLPCRKFLEVDPILSAGANTIPLSDHPRADHMPDSHRLVFRAGLDRSLLDFTYEKEPRPWLRSLQLATLAFTCHQLRAEVNVYIKGESSSFHTNTNLFVTYPLGLLAVREALPELLKSVS
jgi:hypothetical protein